MRRKIGGVYIRTVKAPVNVRLQERAPRVLFHGVVFHKAIVIFARDPRVNVHPRCEPGIFGRKLVELHAPVSVVIPIIYAHLHQQYEIMVAELYLFFIEQIVRSGRRSCVIVEENVAAEIVYLFQKAFHIGEKFFIDFVSVAAAHAPIGIDGKHVDRITALLVLFNLRQRALCCISGITALPESERL